MALAFLPLVRDLERVEAEDEDKMLLNGNAAPGVGPAAPIPNTTGGAVAIDKAPEEAVGARAGEPSLSLSLVVFRIVETVPGFVPGIARMGTPELLPPFPELALDPGTGKELYACGYAVTCEWEIESACACPCGCECETWCG